MTGHARFSPSSAHRWLECPGSVAAGEQFPEVESGYALEGTGAHAVAAALLLNGMRAAQVIGSSFEFKDSKGAKHRVIVDKELAGHVQEYLDVVRTIVMCEDGELFVEHKVKVSDDVWGTGDAFVLTANELHVFDFKYGQGIRVEVDGNEQLGLYLYGKLKQLPHGTLKPTPAPRRYVMHIVQPRNGGHSQAEVSLAWLRQLADRAKAAVLEGKEPRPQLKAGSHCQFCRAAPTCTALRDRSMAAAQEAFAKPAPPLLESIPPARLAEILEQADVVESWIGAVREHALSRAHAGVRIPGYKLVQKIGNREWRNETDAATKLTACGIDPWKKELVSPAQAEKLLGAKAKKIVETMTVNPVRGVKLVHESEKGIPIDATKVFLESPLPDAK